MVESSKDKEVEHKEVSPSSTFFLHPSDHPGLLLVTKRLDGNNYATWRRSMVIALTAKNKIGFVNGTIKAPNAEKKPDDYALWDRCDKMVLSWLLNSVETELADGVVYANTAEEIWRDFHDRFSQGNAPRIFQIERSIGSHVQGTMSVALYYTKLKALWDELASNKTQPACTCGGMQVLHEQQEQDRLMQFLMGLHESYNSTRGHILLMSPLPDVRKAYSLIAQEERQREIGSSSVENISLAAAVHRKVPGNSHFTPRFESKNQLGDGSPSLDHLHCSYCDRDRHTVDTCYKLHGYPPGHRLHRGGGGTHEPTRGGPGARPSNKGKRTGNWRGETAGYQVHAMASSNQQPCHASTLGVSNPGNNGLQQVLAGLSEEQCKQLTAAMVNLTKPSSDNSDAFANAAGLGFGEDDWFGEAE